MKKYCFFSILLLFFFCFSCDEQVEDTSVDNSCGQVPCYEGPFEAPWVGGLEFYGPKGEQWTHDNRAGEYYPMFHLAFRYLLYPEGFGKTSSDSGTSSVS